MNKENHAEVYEGKVLEFRRDCQVSPDLAIGIRGTGTYTFVPRKRKTRVTQIPQSTTDGGDAA